MIKLFKCHKLFTFAFTKCAQTQSVLLSQSVRYRCICVGTEDEYKNPKWNFLDWMSKSFTNRVKIYKSEQTVLFGFNTLEQHNFWSLSSYGRSIFFLKITRTHAQHTPAYMFYLFNIRFLFVFRISFIFFFFETNRQI